MLNREIAIVPDIRVDSRIPQAAYRPTFVRSLVMVPIREADPIGAIGVYWSRCYRAPDEVVARLTGLAEAAGDALARFRPVGQPDIAAARAVTTALDAAVGR